MRIVTATVMLVAGGLWAGNAAAAVTMFHFAGPEEVVQGRTYSPSDGTNRYTVTVWGAKVGSQPLLGAGAQAYMVPEGLAVLDPNAPAGDRSPLINRVQTDGTYGAEYIRLEFSDAVQLSQLKFAFAGPFERFDLAVDGVNLNVPAILGTDVINQLAPPQSFTGTVAMAGAKLPFGKTWDIIAPTSADAWVLENVDVVPEPTTLVVWSALCVGGLVWRPLRRRWAA